MKTIRIYNLTSRILGNTGIARRETKVLSNKKFEASEKKS
jgi:hypothetical protein